MIQLNSEFWILREMGLAFRWSWKVGLEKGQDSKTYYDDDDDDENDFLLKKWINK